MSISETFPANIPIDVYEAANIMGKSREYLPEMSI
jgi:hypothetical protein